MFLPDSLINNAPVIPRGEKGPGDVSPGYFPETQKVTVHLPVTFFIGLR